MKPPNNTPPDKLSTVQVFLCCCLFIAVSGQEGEEKEKKVVEQVIQWEQKEQVDQVDQVKYEVRDCSVRYTWSVVNVVGHAG